MVVRAASSYLDRTVTGRYFGTGNGSRLVWNLACGTTWRALIHPVLYKIDWGGIQQYYSTARTNLVFQSQTLQTAWAPTNVTCAGGDINAVVAPDGTTTADLLRETITNGLHEAHQTTASANVTGTFSVYAKDGGRGWCWLSMNSGGTANYFNLATGEIGATAPNSPTITSVGNGWYRLTLTMTMPLNAGVYLGTASGNGGISFAGDTAKGIYFWGAQLETGSVATPYIPTTTAAVTVTDYSTDTAGKVTFASAPAAGTQLTYKDPWATNVYRHFGLGDGTNVDFSLPFAPATPLIYRRSWAGNELLYATARTNLALQSQTLQTTWSGVTYPCTVTADAGVAPDGTNTADQINATGGVAGHVLTQSVSCTINVTYTMSAFLKMGTSRYAVMGDGNDGVWRVVCFDLLTGTIGTQTNGTATLTPYPNGWYRATFTFTRSSGGTILAGIGPTDTSTRVTFVGALNGTGAETILSWGAQLEVGTTATPYIPTTTAAITVTDYTVAPNGDVTFASAPVDLATLSATMNMGPKP